MNYLAHAYLSFNDPGILAGNMISDFVKGKKQFDFPEVIQKGIKLHRSIDVFTDEHALTKQAKQFFKPAVGLYSGAFVDVAYDHFLACDKNEFTDESLLDFSSSVYTKLDDFQSILPEKFARMLPYMRNDNWLYNYRKLSGTEKSLEGLARRAKYLNNSNMAFNCFKENYKSIAECYAAFFPQLKQFAYNTFINIKK